MGYQNILDAQGFGLAITGMGIVFTVLMLVSLFISCLPRLLPVINAILPVSSLHHTTATPPAAGAAARSVEEEVVAAIALAMHQRRSQG